MKYSGKFIARNLKILYKDHIKDLTFSHTHLPADDWLLIDRTRTYQHTCKNTLHVNQKSVTLMSRASTSRDNIQVNLIQRANWSNNNNVSQPLRIVSIDSDYHRWIYVYDPSSKLKHQKNILCSIILLRDNKDNTITNLWLYDYKDYTHEFSRILSLEITRKKKISSSSNIKHKPRQILISTLLINVDHPWIVFVPS